MTTLITMESSMTWTMMMTMMVSNINKLILHCTGNFNLSYCVFFVKGIEDDEDEDDDNDGKYISIANVILLCLHRHY